jgi:hypothetical protein
MNDFDFFVGSWDVANRRLVQPLSGSDDWDEFPGTSTCVTAWDGAANFDQITFPTKGFRGLTVRMYNPAAEHWSIYWANSRRGVLDLPPMIGRFGRDGTGEFFGTEAFDGRQVPIRFVWDGITATTARWAQAYSPDAGETWETNWVMDFTRTG